MHFGVAMRGAEIVAAPDDSSVTVDCVWPGDKASL